MTLSREVTKREDTHLMLFYNNPKAIQVVHENLVREGHREQSKRRLLRLVQGERA